MVRRAKVDFFGITQGNALPGGSIIQHMGVVSLRKHHGTSSVDINEELKKEAESLDANGVIDLKCVVPHASAADVFYFGTAVKCIIS